MRFRKIYLEISNICNLKCAFCPGTRRPARLMQEEEFSLLLDKLRPYSDFLYFHLMGEPLCHPMLEKYLALAGQQGFRVILTTNGTLLAKQQTLLLQSPAVHGVNVSLHSFEANDAQVPFETYLHEAFSFGQAAQGHCIVSYRLWNEGGSDERNQAILEQLHRYFPDEWVSERRGIRIGERIYLEHGKKFDWPDLQAAEGGKQLFCYALRDQIGILCDGTVVPCCLDHEGDLALGNLLTQDMDEILASPRAKAIYDGFTNHHAVEELCRKCGYARRFRV